MPDTVVPMTTEHQQPDAFRIAVDDAEALILSNMPATGTEVIPLHEASGQILRQTIHAERDQPPFNRATMDGIAISNTAIASNLREFRIAGVQAAGHAAESSTADDECYEVMTGAVMPSGTQAVVPVERISVADNKALLEAGYQPAPNQFVHAQASDHSKNDVLLESGTVINGPAMAVLTAAGSATVEVARWPQVAIVSTGDELVDVGAPIADFQIRSSNDRAIETCLQQRGCRRTSRSCLPDDPDALREHINKLHTENDVLILSGGVSMGKYDYVPAILDELGVAVVFHKILQRPGLPMWFGVSGAGKPVFALPGNPVSTIVCCVRYVIPALLKVLGQRDLTAIKIQLAEAVEFAPDLTWFLPVALHSSDTGILQAVPRPTNTSGDFIGLRNTAGFIELPRGQNHFPAGFAANLYRW
jgi:molybdopterin molybdotransferase